MVEEISVSSDHGKGLLLSTLESGEGYEPSGKSAAIEALRSNQGQLGSGSSAQVLSSFEHLQWLGLHSISALHVSFLLFNDDFFPL